jgi:hypothetical protein
VVGQRRGRVLRHEGQRVPSKCWPRTRGVAAMTSSRTSFASRTSQSRAAPMSPQEHERA